MGLPSELLSLVQHRRAAVEGVSDDGSFTGLIVPYEVEVELFPGLREVFARKSLRAAVKDPARVKVMDESHGAAVVGMAVELQDREDGLWGRFTFAPTQDAQDVRTKLAGGFLDELSIEFRQIRDAQKIEHRDDGTILVRHMRAQVLGVAPVAHGAYGRSALVDSARSGKPDRIELARRDTARLLALLSD